MEREGGHRMSSSSLSAQTAAAEPVAAYVQGPTAEGGVLPVAGILSAGARCRGSPERGGQHPSERDGCRNHNSHETDSATAAADGQLLVSAPNSAGRTIMANKCEGK